ncbi:hypothetical protein ACIPC1_10340 [Streptomyces sp. NPDC087263]|uniref:hypothetical protein n=1 Tax=Streptomyces sp. NPDC087263 TaxID=3365773 RepID=UPI0038048D65
MELEVGLARDGAGLSDAPVAQFVGVRGEQLAHLAQDGGAGEVRAPEGLSDWTTGRLGGAGGPLRSS